MANRKTDERDVRKLGQEGDSSVGMTLPIGLVRELGWKVKQKVTVRKWGNKLLISDWKSKK